MKFLATMIATALTLGTAHAELNGKQLMKQAYKRYFAKGDCWLTSAPADGQTNYYCMQIDHEEIVQTAAGPRLFLMATGNSVEANGAPLDDMHASPGLIGAFVARDEGGKVVIEAQNPRFFAGHTGRPPTKWKLLQLGADYWGWLNIDGNCFAGGVCGGWHLILAPRGKAIVQLTKFTATQYSWEGMLSAPETAANLDTALTLDTRNAADTIYPLKVTVTGTIGEKPYKQRSWTIPFNPKTWTYPEPKDWPFKKYKL